MPSFFLAEIDVLDLEKYQEYVDRVSQIVQNYGGEYVFRSDSITPVSGDWVPRRLVLIRFNNKTDLQMCFGSEEYLAITHLREQSTKSRAVIIEQDAEVPTRRMQAPADSSAEPQPSAISKKPCVNFLLFLCPFFERVHRPT